jgi:hypothetical protein
MELEMKPKMKLTITTLSNIVASVILATAALGCAKANYSSDTSANSGEKGQAASCDLKFAKSGDCVEIAWKEKPTETKAGSFVFKISHSAASGQSSVPMDPQMAASVVLWMPAMGHGSTPVTVTKIDDGADPAVSFLASEVRFIMPGEWQIKLQIKQANEVIDEAVLDYVL